MKDGPLAHTPAAALAVG